MAASPTRDRRAATPPNGATGQPIPRPPADAPAPGAFYRTGRTPAATPTEPPPCTPAGLSQHWQQADSQFDDSMGDDAQPRQADSIPPPLTPCSPPHPQQLFATTPAGFDHHAEPPLGAVPIHAPAPPQAGAHDTPRTCSHERDGRPLADPPQWQREPARPAPAGQPTEQGGGVTMELLLQEITDSRAETTKKFDAQDARLGDVAKPLRALDERTGAVETATRALQTQTADIDRRPTELEKRPPTAPTSSFPSTTRSAATRDPLAPGPNRGTHHDHDGGAAGCHCGRSAEACPSCGRPRFPHARAWL